MFNLKVIANKINIRGDLLLNESMAAHTTFKTGGPADILALPHSLEDLKRLLKTGKEEMLPVTILGGGANVLVSDKGIRGLVIGTERLKSFSIKGDRFRALPGLAMSTASRETAAAGLEGLETFYAMPGTLGGALWMNARCYGRSISESLSRVTLLSPEGEFKEMKTGQKDFGYKVSPFQSLNSIILEAEFLLTRGDSRRLREVMTGYEEDRRSKGHFKAPSAGSVFKNNRDFGKPSGLIVDEAGLKGYRIGGAQVSPGHGNIIFNTGGASSSDIRRLITYVKNEVERQFGFRLEEEVIYAGTWDEEA